MLRGPLLARGAIELTFIIQTLQYTNVHRDLNAYNTTFSNGSLGSRIDEERSEMR